LIATDGRPSATHQSILFMIESFDVTPRTTEQNLIVRIGKSEAEITNTKILHSLHSRYSSIHPCLFVYCTVEATERHEASRGLSAAATAELGLLNCSVIATATHRK